ncbi:uncharacterized protein FA14DRAFT_138591 [Meira miltonrushii]|uniref:Spindle pole body component n=1 Tax=Meira miltonrushii TaxID=1280837 RepID=A0A316V3B0_9BASI|nr:uncharacterized protein FA14DRAFT_138591 [Meira miltonrushii]PWN32047.1 hypothetical protein FA14DRAFT_138591 [Meira miltonrushii]
MLVSKMKKQPGLSREVNGLLELVQELAFTNRLVSHGQNSVPYRQRTPKLDSAQTFQTDKQNGATKHASSNEAETKAPLAPSTSAANNANQEAAITNGLAALNLTTDEKMLPKAMLLQRWREKRGQVPISEAELMRDIIYLLQGINGKYVGFEDVLLPASNEMGETREAERIVKVKFSQDSEHLISHPTKHLIHRVAELGRLYKRIDEFHRQFSQKEGTGLIMQSLCHFVLSELTDYYRLVAILEAQMNNVETDGNDQKGLTLRRISVWTEEVTLRMRLISTIIEGCQDAHGGAIVSLIHSYTFHGDPLIRKFTAEILDQVSKPFFHALSLWIFEGELQDPFEEFFVEANKDLKATWGPTGEDLNSALYMSTSQDHHMAPPSSLWQNQFRFRTEMLPSFIRESFGRKIFSTGKSLNFIRFSCDDADWVATKASQRKEGNAILRYANLPGLERTIDEAYASASTRLLDIFIGKYKLMAHLRALKDYLMLTKGDFTDLLMESIGPSLDKPASSLFRHNLTASLETSIRGSNSQYDDVDIVGRLDARILDFSEGDLGWDSFTLEYRVDEPVSTVLDNHAMLGYQIIFNHLWKVKRVELALGSGWEKLLLAANMLRRIQPRTLKKAALARRATIEPQSNLGEQIHFVKQLQGFVNLEVVEYSWNDLTQLFSTQANHKNRLMDLDELISTHRAYLNTLISKIMLRGVTSSSSGRRAPNDQLAVEVKANLDTMLAFALAIEDLARYIVDQVARSDLSGNKNRTSTPVNSSSRPGTPSLTSQASRKAPIDASSLENIKNRLESNHAKFQSSTQMIIGKLEKHSNLVVRDLATRLNFNSYYSHLSSSTSVAAVNLPGQSRR